VAIWRDAFGHARAAAGGAPDRILRYVTLRRLIDQLVTDLIATIEHRITDRDLRSAADIRALREPLVGFSAALEAQRLELKSFLLENLYRHYRVVRMMRKAQDLMRALFQAYAAEPSQLPPHILRRHTHAVNPSRAWSRITSPG